MMEIFLPAFKLFPTTLSLKVLISLQILAILSS